MAFRRMPSGEKLAAPAYYCPYEPHDPAGLGRPIAQAKVEGSGCSAEVNGRSILTEGLSAVDGVEVELMNGNGQNDRQEFGRSYRVDFGAGAGSKRCFLWR